MSTLLDSAVEFAARATELGLDEFLPKMTALNVKCFADLATMTDWTPGGGNPEAFFTDLVIPILDSREHVKKNTLRRLFIESFTLFAGDLKSRTENRGEEAPRKLPDIERESRLKALKLRLGPGVMIKNDLEPSSRLIDLAHSMYEENVVRHLDWQVQTKRPSEIQGNAKEEKIWKPNSKGLIQEFTEIHDNPANLTSDFMLRCVLQRRSVALDIANLVSYEIHELWASTLLDILVSEPPPGHENVNLNQLRYADQKLWERADNLCRDGVRPKLGKRPLETAFTDLMFSPEIRLLLLPLRPAATLSSSSRSSAFGSAPMAPQRERSQREEQLEREVANLKRKAAQPQNPIKQHKGNGKGKGKHDKGKGKKRTTPAGLDGKNLETTAGEPICWNFNLPQGCAKARQGERCLRGFHVCAEPGCGAAHPLSQHR